MGERKCECGKLLRCDNKSGICSKCQHLPETRAKLHADRAGPQRKCLSCGRLMIRRSGPSAVPICKNNKRCASVRTMFIRHGRLERKHPVVDPRPCKVCGKIMTASVLGICRKNPACQTARSREQKRISRDLAPEKHREANRRWRKQNPEAARQLTRLWRENNMALVREIHRSWCSRNQEHVNERSRQHYAKNPERYKDVRRVWKATHKESGRETARRKRQKTAVSELAALQNILAHKLQEYEDDNGTVGETGNTMAGLA